ncbi:substrate-binding domain-containing protein [Peribacillus frigoritolerans]|nr:substrate-binding domain-containing protein [Peribacillus frigoritolerans]
MRGYWVLQQAKSALKGVEDAAKEAGLEIAASQAADYDRVKAVSAMENILTANPDIKGVFTANDEMALGALKSDNFSKYVSSDRWR